MRTLKRNKQSFYYCLYSGKEVIYDEYGNECGTKVNYGEVTEMKANVSQATGQSNTEMFGNLDSYDKVIVTDDMDCEIDENTVLFIDKEPAYGAFDVLATSDGNPIQIGDEVMDTAHDVPLYDYIVRRVAKSLNSISIAVRKVDVS